MKRSRPECKSPRLHQKEKDYESGPFLFGLIQQCHAGICWGSKSALADLFALLVINNTQQISELKRPVDVLTGRRAKRQISASPPKREGLRKWSFSFWFDMVVLSGGKQKKGAFKGVTLRDFNYAIWKNSTFNKSSFLLSTQMRLI